MLFYGVLRKKREQIYRLWYHIMFMAMKTVKLERDEYQDILDCMQRMRETIEVLSSRETVKKLEKALERVESGEFLTKKDMVF